MKKTLSTLAILIALAAPFAVSAQDQGENGSGQMTQEGLGQGGMMQGDMPGMMGMMSEMGPMMEACTEMMAAMTEDMNQTDPGTPEPSDG